MWRSARTVSVRLERISTIHTCPFFIHAENAERYKAAVRNPEQLLLLFQEEQERYRTETAPFVMDYDEENAQL